MVPIYAYHRSPQFFFPCPDKFWPRRWLKRAGDQLGNDRSGTSDKSYEVHNQAAFMPFSLGPANCVGKHFATMEARMVVAALMQQFDIRFADGYDSADWEAALEEFSVLKKGPLPVMLTPRT